MSSPPSQISTLQRHIWHLDMIPQSIPDVCYILGSQNEAGEALSRLQISALHTEVSSPMIDFQAHGLAQMK